VSIAVLLIFPGWLFAIVVTLVILFASGFFPKTTLYVLVFLLPFAPYLDSGFVVREMGTIVRILAFVGFLLGYVLRGKPIKKWLLRSQCDHLAWAVLGVAVFSMTVAHGFSHITLRALVRLVSYVFLYFMVTAYVASCRDLWKLINSLLWSTLLVALFGLYQSVHGSFGDLPFSLSQTPDLIGQWDPRIPSFLGYSNLLAAYLNLVLPLALGAGIIELNRGRRILGFAVTSLGCVALFLTQSRGALVAFVVILIFVLFSLEKRRNRRVTILVSILAAILVALPMMASFSNHFESIETESGTMRLFFWSAGLAMFTSSPLLGVGYGNFREMYSSFPGMDWISEGAYDAHNIYIQTLAETGLVGFLVFVLFIRLVMRSAFQQLWNGRDKLDRLIGLWVAAAVIGVLIHGFVDYTFQASPQFGSLFWLAIGVMVVNGRRGTTAVSGASPRGSSEGLLIRAGG